MKTLTRVCGISTYLAVRVDSLTCRVSSPATVAHETEGYAQFRTTSPCSTAVRNCAWTGRMGTASSNQLSPDAACNATPSSREGRSTCESCRRVTGTDRTRRFLARTLHIPREASCPPRDGPGEATGATCDHPSDPWSTAHTKVPLVQRLDDALNLLGFETNPTRTNAQGNQVRCRTQPLERLRGAECAYEEKDTFLCSCQNVHTKPSNVFIFAFET